MNRSTAQETATELLNLVSCIHSGVVYESHCYGRSQVLIVAHSDCEDCAVTYSVSVAFYRRRPTWQRYEIGLLVEEDFGDVSSEDYTVKSSSLKQAKVRFKQRFTPGR